MELIQPTDSAYFTVSSNDLYDRHNYKIVSKTGDSIVVDNWEDAQMTWFQKNGFLSHIEVLDQPKISNQKGFK
jgi:hypothetical protein